LKRPPAMTTFGMLFKPMLDATRTDKPGTARQNNGIGDSVQADVAFEIVFELSDRVAEILGEKWSFRIAHFVVYDGRYTDFCVNFDRVSYDDLFQIADGENSVYSRKQTIIM
jgi:hypothetical protein